MTDGGRGDDAGARSSSDARAGAGDGDDADAQAASPASSALSGPQSADEAGDTLLRAIAFAPAVAPGLSEDPTELAQFRIEARLGRGGMGVVYRARDRKLNRDVALKVMKGSLAEDARGRARFLREARSAAAITHPNIAAVYEVGEVDGRLFIAMELVDGPSLRERLARGPLPADEALRLARGVARGLARAHERGVVHRDLKPDNVMVDGDHQPKILDFGLAKLREGAALGPPRPGHEAEVVPPSTQAGFILGTPGYMAPEQFGGEADARADVFAFGVCLYEMLTGARPTGARGATSDAVAEAVDAAASASDLRRRVSGVSPTLEAIVQRCLARSREERYASGRELLAALEALDDPPRDAGAAPPSDAGRSRRTWTVGLLFLALAAATGAVFRAVAGGGSESSVARGAPGASAASAPRATSPAPAPSGTPITRASPPQSKNTEALAAYTSGLQRLRDASRASAADDFERAAALDPALAAAHLRAVLYAMPNAPIGALREHGASAAQYRAALDERERLLLGVAELFVADAPSRDEMRGRARAAATRFPDDAEASLVLGDVLLRLRDVEGARTELARALSLDPEFAFAELELGDSYRYAGAQDEALAHYDRCVAISPSAGGCLLGRADVAMARGRCADAETDARRMLIVEPRSSRTYEYLALALAGRNAPLDAVRDAMAKRTALEPEGRRPVAAAQASLWTALLAGDLVTAEAAARAWEALAAGSLVESDHARSMHHLFDVLEERGDVAALLAAADAYERRASAWTLDDPLGLRLRIAVLRRHAGRLDDAGLERVRAALVREAGEKRPDQSPFWVWYLARATFLETREEAERALAAMPDASPHVGAKGLWEDNLGRMFLLAGQPARAVPYLKDAVGSCSVMSSEDGPAATTVWYMRAHVYLGRALEETGDRTGACATYRALLERWPRVRPRSVARERALERTAKLGCPAAR